MADFEKPQSNLEQAQWALARKYIQDRISGNNVVAIEEVKRHLPRKTDADILRLYQSVYNKTEFSVEEVPGQGSCIIATRHSLANYKRMGQMADTKPLEPVPFLQEEAVENFADISKIKINDRETGRLSGAELIQREAMKLYRSLNRATDVLFFASSPAERAMQTAMEYRKIADRDADGHKLFTILEQGEYDAAQQGKLGNPVDIQKMDIMRSLEMEAPIYLSDIFCPSSLYPDELITDGVVDVEKIFAMPAWQEMERQFPEKARLWREAKKIILAEEQKDIIAGRKPSWSDYYFKFGKEFKEFFSDIPDPVEVSRLRLKIYNDVYKTAKNAFYSDPVNADKNFIFQYFTHDEAFASLDDLFGEKGHKVANCESIRFIPNPDGTTTVIKGGEIKTARLG